MNREELLKLAETKPMNWLRVSPVYSNTALYNLIKNLPVDEFPYVEVFYEITWLDGMQYSSFENMINEFCIFKAQKKLGITDIPYYYEIIVKTHGKELLNFSVPFTKEEYDNISKSSQVNLDDAMPIRYEYTCEIEEGETEIKGNSYYEMIDNIIKYCLNNWQLFSYRSMIKDALPETYSEEIYRGDKLISESHCNPVQYPELFYIQFALENRNVKKELYVAENMELSPTQYLPADQSETFIGLLEQTAHTVKSMEFEVDDNGIINSYGDYCCGKYNHYISGKEPHAERNIYFNENDFNAIKRFAKEIK